MLLTDFAKGKAWGIIPAYFQEMAARLPDIKESKDLAISFTEKPQERDEYLLVDGGVAVIPVYGPLSKRKSFFSFFFGGASYTALTEVLNAALEDPKVKSIVFDIDSPGGTVSGTEALGDLIFESRGIKPMVAFANGTMASAAYWIGSGADVVVAERTAEIGSVGVLMVHYDWSKEDEKMGLKRTYISAGQYKALGNDAEPLSSEAKEMFQAELDYIYTLFVDTVARNRGVSTADVLDGMADGRIFIGEQAIEAGLADITGSLPTAIETARQLAEGTQADDIFTLPSNVAQKENNKLIKGGKEMKIETIEALKEAFPNLVKDIEAAAVAGIDTKAMETAARDSEQARIMGLVDVQFGAEAGEAFKAIVNTGVSIDQFKAIKGTTPPAAENDQNAAMAAMKEEILASLQDAGPTNPGAGNANTGTGDKDYMVLVSEHKTANQCSHLEALQAVAKIHPEAHQAYLKAVN